MSRFDLSIRSNIKFVSLRTHICFLNKASFRYVERKVFLSNYLDLYLVFAGLGFDYIDDV